MAAPASRFDASLTDTVEDNTIQIRKRAPSPEPDPAKTPAPRAAEIVECPHCSKRLIDPEGMALCPGCGYCGSLEENRDKVPPAPEPEPARHPLQKAAAAARRGVLGWACVMVAGAVALVLVSMVADKMLPRFGRERALWSTVQLACGAAVMLIAQWWAVVKLACEHENIGPLDLVVLSGRTWARAFRRMPVTRGPVYLGFWALVLMVTAVTVVGGLSDWFAATAHAGSIAHH